MRFPRGRCGGHLDNGRRVVELGIGGDFAFFGAEEFSSTLPSYVAGEKVARRTFQVDGRGGNNDLPGADAQR